MFDPKTLAALKSLDLDKLKCLSGFGAVEEKLANAQLRLESGRVHHRRPGPRSFAVLSKARNAAQQLDRLPGNGESIHCVLKGDYALFDFIPAVLENNRRRPIRRLRIATLGFSRSNVEGLVALAGDGLIHRLDVLCSHYFAAADAEIYRFMVEALRGSACRVVAMRTHAKVLLMDLGRCKLTVESSANLRSCHNVEQATIVHDKRLHDFHADWMDELLDRGTRERCAAESPNRHD